MDDGYKNLDFPFDPVEGEDGTGPFKFETRREMNLDELFTYLRSWSAYQTALEKGVDLLDEDAAGGELRRAWGAAAVDKKTVVFPISLRIGTVK